MDLTIVMPCYNEEDTIYECVMIAINAMKKNKIKGEVLVVDNNCTDNSAKLAKMAGARVIEEKKQGYGAAINCGNNNANGKYIIMADCDCSYDFDYIGEFFEYLNNGYDMVIGNRFTGNMDKNAMSFTHKYIGNPVLSFIGRKLFKIKVGDFHCGLRGYSKEKILSLNLESDGMEYASEMVIKATKARFKIKEIPIDYKKDHRVNTNSKLRTIRDGYRHLKLMLQIYFRGNKDEENKD